MFRKYFFQRALRGHPRGVPGPEEDDGGRGEGHPRDAVQDRQGRGHHGAVKGRRAAGTRDQRPGGGLPKWRCLLFALKVEL